MRASDDARFLGHEDGISERRPQGRRGIGPVSVNGNADKNALTHSSPISTQPITSVQDMPQTVTVVSGQVMQEQAVTTLDDALKNGRITAGAQSAEAKHNLQVPENSPAHREAGDIILGALGRNELFTSASLAQKVFPPLFNRYDAGMAFGTHIDNAIRFVKTAGPPLRIRTDLSATLFLTEPADYDGGELIILDSFGSHSVKLPAGDLALYSATSRHNVTAVKHGSRVSSFFWIQSMVRDTDARQMLFELDGAIQGLRKTQGDSEEIVTLTGLYHNLLRRWADA